MLTQGKSHFKQGGAGYEEEPADCDGICRGFQEIGYGLLILHENEQGG
jgi:hypothetical protein